MTRIAFADESNTTGKPACYAIGVVSIGVSQLASFNNRFEELAKAHGLVGEAKWQKIGKSHGQINLLLDWARLLVAHPGARFDSIVVHTGRYKKWTDRNTDREVAFYVTYAELLKHMARRGCRLTEVLIDDRQDSYAKRPETTELIVNRMLVKTADSGRLENLRKVQSRSTPGIQIADLLTGAICAGHELQLLPARRPNPGKNEAIKRLAATLGWDALHYDTMPDSKFNIWHFPYPEYRGPTRPVHLQAAQYIDASALREAWFAANPRAA
jgi:hypothetical protein